MSAAAPPPSRLPGLDGLRALAIGLVLLYHAELPGLAPAGFLGVDVFFVLSGFLITMLLLGEVARTGDVNLGAFYRRRARRLLPALLAVLAACLVASATVAPDTAAALRRDLPAALVYGSNWGQIATGQSYFEATGRPPLLQHLWSLAIEEQFYLAWPALALITLRFGGRRGLLVLTTGLAGATTAWMTWLSLRHGFPVEAEPTRVYVGTDTHTMGLFTGAALAVATSLAGESPRETPRGTRPSRLLGAGSAGVLVWGAWGVAENSDGLYRGGFALYAAASAVLLWAVLRQDEPVGRLAEHPVVRAIGERSYGLYLWHWPVFQLLRPGLDVPLGPWPTLALRLAVTALVSELCYRGIETPWRTPSARDGAVLDRWLPAAALAAPALLAAVLVLQAPATPTVAADVRAALEGRGGDVDAVGSSTGPGLDPRLTAGVTAGVTRGLTAGDRAENRPEGASPDRRDDPSDARAGDPAARDLATRATTRDPAMPAETEGSAHRTARGNAEGTAEPGAGLTLLEGTQAVAFGDSVLLGASRPLQHAIGALVVDAEVGRQADGLLHRIEARQAEAPLQLPVIVHLGTNGFVAERQLRTLLTHLHDCPHVYLVNAHAPRRWVDPNNAILATVGREFANVTFVDWHAVADGHPEYFASDDIHLSGAGLRAFTAALEDAGHFLPPSRYRPLPPATPDGETDAPPGPGSVTQSGTTPEGPLPTPARAPLPAAGSAGNATGVARPPPPGGAVPGAAPPATTPAAVPVVPGVPAPVPAAGAYSTTAWRPGSGVITLDRPAHRRVGPWRHTRNDPRGAFYRRVLARGGPPAPEPPVPLEAPRALNAYWDRMAACETGGRWARVARFGGGLGIYIGTWLTYGGREFAPTPDQASREDQIRVANRIATVGWERPGARPVPAVGFRAWGCEKTVGWPALLHYEPDSVLHYPFRWGQVGEAIHDLQVLLAVPLTGVYDTLTASAHAAYRRAHALDGWLPIPPAPPPGATPARRVPVE